MQIKFSIYANKIFNIDKNLCKNMITDKKCAKKTCKMKKNDWNYSIYYYFAIEIIIKYEIYEKICKIY